MLCAGALCVPEYCTYVNPPYVFKVLQIYAYVCTLEYKHTHTHMLLHCVCVSVVSIHTYIHPYIKRGVTVVTLQLSFPCVLCLQPTST